MPHGFTTQVARSTPFDNSTNGFESTEVQSAIEELSNKVDVSASPGFTWGRSGNVSAGAYLQNDSVPSNTSGRIVPISAGFITDVFVASENADTFDVEIQKRTGPGAYSVLATISLTAQRTKTQTFTGVSVSLGDELAAYVSSGSCKNPVAGVIIKGVV